MKVYELDTVFLVLALKHLGKLDFKKLEPENENCLYILLNNARRESFVFSDYNSRSAWLAKRYR